MPDDLSLTQNASGSSQLVTVTKPTDHFTEILYIGVIVLLLGFSIFMSHVHNDQLAAKSMDFVLIVLGALTQSSTGGVRKTN